MLQPRLTSVKALPDMKLHLIYETGEEILFGVSPYVEGSWYGELKDSAYFQSVKLLPGGIGIEWIDGQDISPHELYDCSLPI